VGCIPKVVSWYSGVSYRDTIRKDMVLRLVLGHSWLEKIKKRRHYSSLFSPTEALQQVLLELGENMTS
jgi:hypothetical protein